MKQSCGLFTARSRRQSELGRSEFESGKVVQKMKVMRPLNVSPSLSGKRDSNSGKPEFAFYVVPSHSIRLTALGGRSPNRIIRPDRASYERDSRSRREHIFGVTRMPVGFQVDSDKAQQSVTGVLVAVISAPCPTFMAHQARGMPLSAF